jgi:hypothetical protein
MDSPLDLQFSAVVWLAGVLIRRTMRCPICNSEFDPTQSTARPFCSERCRTIDLGRWLGETYHLPLPPDPEADDPPHSEDNANGAAQNA